MPQAALLGQLVFTLQSKQFSEIEDRQISKQCATKSWMHYIQGELYGDQPGSESFHLDVAIQQSIHQFHGESWSFFTFCDILNESIGKEGERLVGSGRGHFSSWCDLHSVCPDPHQDPNRSKWIYDVSEDMERFEMALFDKKGRWTQNTSPLDHAAHSIGIHPHAAVVFAPNKGFRAILEAIVTTCGMLGDSPRYWKYTGDTTPHHWKDGGLTLTNAGRWRSDSCLWFIKRKGWEHVPQSIYDELRGLVEALPNEQQPAAEPAPSNVWVERAPFPRKRHPEKSWTPHPPEPQRAKPADTKPVPQAGPSPPQPPAPPPAPNQRSPAAAKPVPQAVSGPAVPVQQAMSHSVTPQAAVQTQHDDIRQRLFSDSLQRQLFARHVPQRPQRAALQGTPSGLNPVPKNAPPGNTQECDMGNREQPSPNATVVDLTTTTDDPPRQSPTEASSAANQAEEQLSETTVRTPSISGSDVSRRDSLVNQARLDRLQEEKHRVDKEHKHILERLVELDTKRRLLDSEIDQTRTELVEEAEEASNRSLSTSVKSSRK